ncbi:hypothetical protein GCM10009742_70250 [Kribbella karoonensis]|uniref:Uncharacterized protein n=1 Tax=Kribbella karoonensis TaxID=324851 RepID=A0ABN2EL38_9ACTN
MVGVLDGLPGVVLTRGFGRAVVPLVRRGGVGDTVTVVTPTVGVAGVVGELPGELLTELPGELLGVPAVLGDSEGEPGAEPTAAGPTTAVVVAPFGKVFVIVIIGPVVVPSSTRLFSTTFTTRSAPSVREVPCDISQTTGPIATSTESALTTGPTRPRLRRGARLLPRCRRGVGESVMGWANPLRFFVMPKQRVVPRGTARSPLVTEQRP